MYNLANEKIWVAAGVKKKADETIEAYYERKLVTLGKAPIGIYANWQTDPYFSTYEEAKAYDHYQKTGVGFMTIPPIAVIDLDKCYDAEGYILEDAAKVLEHSTNTYAERSISGNGAHVVGFYHGAHGNEQLSTNSAMKAELGFGIELFPKIHHVTYSGRQYEGSSDTVDDFTALYDKLYDIVWNGNIKLDPVETPDAKWKEIRGLEDCPFDIFDVWSVPKNRPTAWGYLMEHPNHGSTNGGNLVVKFDGMFFKCFRCHSIGHSQGGDAWTALALDAGIIRDCDEKLKGDKWNKTCLEAIRRGLIK